MTDEDVIYIPGLAKMLDKSDAAVRAMLHRTPEKLPKSFRIGRKYAWNRADVRAWLKKQAKGGV